MAKNPKMVMCRNCNTAIAGNVKKCPACGAKNKKPFYKKWWFILIVIIIIGVLASKGRNNGEEFSWSDIELGEQLPIPESNVGNIISNSDDYLSMYVYKTSSKDYKAYIKACEDEGYVIESDKSTSHYDAYNSEGYKLGLWYNDNDEKLSISLDAPEEMKEISWATTGIGDMLPVPKSNVGKVTKDSSDAYIVKVGNTSIDDYAEYVKACEEVGFTVDYSKYDESYSASNAEGYKLSLRYIGFNTMEVSIKAPEETKQTDNNDDKIGTDNNKDTSVENNNAATSETPETKDTNIELIDGMRPEIKAAIDAYEEFMGKYAAFMKKYQANPTDLSLLTEVASYMSDYDKFEKDFKALEDTEMNIAEAAYYIEVQLRVSNILLEIIQ